MRDASLCGLVRLGFPSWNPDPPGRGHSKPADTYNGEVAVGRHRRLVFIKCPVCNYLRYLARGIYACVGRTSSDLTALRHIWVVAPLFEDPTFGKHGPTSLSTPAWRAHPASRGHRARVREMEKRDQERLHSKGNLGALRWNHKDANARSGSQLFLPGVATRHADNTFGGSQGLGEEGSRSQAGHLPVGIRRYQG